MTVAFARGDRVRVRADRPESGPVQAHVRTPSYLRGHRGIVERVLGAFPNPEELAFGRPGLPKRSLYRVTFTLAELWPGAAASDTVAADLYEHWLEADPERNS